MVECCINKDLLSLKGAVPHIVSKKVDHRATSGYRYHTSREEEIN